MTPGIPACHQTHLLIMQPFAEVLEVSEIAYACCSLQPSGLPNSIHEGMGIMHWRSNGRQDMIDGSCLAVRYPNPVHNHIYDVEKVYYAMVRVNSTITRWPQGCLLCRICSALGSLQTKTTLTIICSAQSLLKSCSQQPLHCRTHVYRFCLQHIVTQVNRYAQLS